MEDQRSRDQQLQDRFDQMQRSIELLIQNQAAATGGLSSSGGTLNTLVIHSVPISSTTCVKEISLGFSHFDGQSPIMEWIFKAEKFNYHHTPDQDRVNIASIHFEKDVIPWFHMLQRLQTVNTWAELRRALESQFGPLLFDCPMAELFKLQQVGTVADYYLKFMGLAHRFEGLTLEVLLNCFISGLNKDIRRDVVAQALADFLRAVSLAKLYEEKYVSVPSPCSTPFTP
ncbi:hypothetical protein GmHk_13G036094 [Glycine max]|nr:hypothetical protein GmHk_13G036094 [Glycine max]